MNANLKRYASEFARLGGQTRSPRKAAAAKKNGALGGRPKILGRRKTTAGKIL